MELDAGADVITYLLMAALFESFLYPFVIMFSGAAGRPGWLPGTRGHQPLRAPEALDVLTMLGFVILIGTVVNNAILIVHQSLNHMRDEGTGAARGDPRRRWVTACGRSS